MKIELGAKVKPEKVFDEKTYAQKEADVMSAQDANDRKWTSYLVLMVLFCTALAAAFMVYFSKLDDTVRQETETYLAECGDQAAHNLRDDFRLLLNSTAMMADFVGRSNENLFNHKFMLSLAARSRSAYFSYLGIADVNGLMHTIDGRVLNVSDREYFKQAMNGRANISPLLPQKTSGERSIVFAAPITRNGDIIGVLCAPLAPKDFVSVFRITVFNGDGDSYVTDDQGDIVMSKVGFDAKGNIADIFGSSGSGVLGSLLKAMSAGADGVSRFFMGGEAVYIGYTPIGYNNWYLLMTIADKVVNRRFAGFKRLTVFCGIFLFIFFTLLAVLTFKIFRDKNRELGSTMKDLRASEERYKIVTENSDEHIFEWNMDKDFIYYSPSYERHFGAVNAESRSIASMLKSSRLSPEDAEKLAGLSEEFQNGRTSADLELRLKIQNGDWRWCSFKAMAIGGGARRVVGVLKDIDEEYRERQLLLHKSQTDKLTGLFDKLTTQETIGGYLEGPGKNSRHTLMILDVDDFKAINDNYGHFFGDQALQAVAEKMKATFRGDDVIGRTGGDEFMVLLKNTCDSEFVKRKSHELAEALRHCMDDSGHKNCVSVSLGIAFYPAAADDFACLYKAADSALYQAKNSGKNSFALYRKGREAQIFKCDERERSFSLLVVSNSEDHRDELRRILETEYSVVEADCRENAVRLLREVRDIGAVVADIPQPSDDALALLLSQLRKSASAVDLPLIIISDAAGDDARLKATNAGAAELVARPLDAEGLRARVRGVIARAVLSHMEREKQLYKDLSSSNSQLQSIVDTVPCGIAMIRLEADGSVRPTFFSDAFCQLSGSTREFVETSDLFSFIQPDDLHLVKELAREVLENNRTKVECRFRIVDQYSRKRWISMTGEQFHEENGSHMFSLIFLDTTDEVLRQQKEELEARELLYKSRHDQLTGIYNRETFFAETERMLASDQGGKYVMVCCDVDRFSVVNELFGNKTGDKVLSDIPHIFTPIAQGNCRYGRIGGDIFAACLPYGLLDTDLIENSARYRCPHLGGRYELTLRFGIYIIGDHSLAADVMCDRAILALRTIKGSYSKHHAFYNTAIRDRMFAEQEITSEMEQALADGEFEVWFQPICELETEHPAMAEALVRWKRPGKGLVMPGAFIPLFERNGFISKLDAFVWEEACRRLAEMKQLGLDTLPISVNISRLDFYAGGVSGCLSALTEKFGVAPQDLRLEITESTYSRDPSMIGQAISDLHTRGFTLMVDDFGSGWSTLETIKAAPVDMMKIDKKLIDDIAASPRARIVLDSVIRMAQTIGMTVVAEGVESQEQADILLKMKCDLVQGFHYCKPLPWSDFTELLRRS